MSLFPSNVPPSTLKSVVAQCNQQDKFSLLRVSKVLYENTLPCLYSNIFLIATMELKPIKSLDKKRVFLYPNNKTVISTKKSIGKFVKLLQKSRLNFNGTVILTNFVKSFECVFLSSSDGSPLFDLSPVLKPEATLYTIADLENFQTDCSMYIRQSNGRIELPTFLVVNVLKLISCLRDSLQELRIPLGIHSKLFDNELHHDFLRNRNARDVKATIMPTNTSEDSWLKYSLLNFASFCRHGYTENALLKLNLYHIGLSLNLSLAQLTKISISMSDISTAKKLLSCCESGKLKCLKLYHLGCFNERNDFKSRRPGYLSQRLFRQIDDFFENINIVQIIANLQCLDFVFHNGYNRMVFKKFLFSLYHYVVMPQKKDRNDKTGLMKLKHLGFSEITSDISKIQDTDYTVLENANRLLKDDVRHVSTMLLIYDLFSISSTFQLKDIVSFDHLRSLKLSTCGFLGNSRVKSTFQMTFMAFIDQKVMEQLLPYRNHLDFKFIVNQYDRNTEDPMSVVLVD